MRPAVRALKTVNYKLWAAIMLSMMLPSVYQTVRIFFLGDMPSDWGFNIASQLSWVSLFYEVIQEALILPLFFLLGKSVNNKKEFENKVRTGLIVTGIIYASLSVLILIFTNRLVVFMAQEAALINKTVTYIRLETVAMIFSTLSRFMMLVLLSLKKHNYMYISLFIQMMLSVISDTFLISGLKFSANVGVNGIAISNILVNAVVLIVCAALLKKENIRIFAREKLSFMWLKEWFKVGKFSGLESLLRNFAFVVMILRMVNLVAEQGNYWVANNFIWGWLLLPGLALADLVKKEIAVDENNIKKKTFGYLTLTAIFSLLWLASIPLWKPFIHHIMNVASYEQVYRIVLIQTAFYLTFLFNSCIFDSTFYGLGKTQYMLIQSICIDGFYYGFMFVLYLTKVFVPSLLGISIMFGLGMLLDFVPTMFLYLRMLNKKGIKIDFKLQ